MTRLVGGYLSTADEINTVVAAGRADVHQRYSVERLLDDVDRLYRSLLGDTS